MAIFYKPRGSWWDQVNQRTALGQPVNPSDIEGALYGERYGELSALASREQANKDYRLRERELGLRENQFDWERQFQEDALNQQMASSLMGTGAQLAIAYPGMKWLWGQMGSQAAPGVMGGAGATIGGAGAVPAISGNALANYFGGTGYGSMTGGLGTYSPFGASAIGGAGAGAQAAALTGAEMGGPVGLASGESIFGMSPALASALPYLAPFAIAPMLRGLFPEHTLMGKVTDVLSKPVDIIGDVIGGVGDFFSDIF